VPTSSELCSAMRNSFGTVDRKVPESKRYAHVRSNIDTGATARKQHVTSAAAVARQRDEIFKRIRPGTLVRLLQERDVCESIYAHGPGSDAGCGNSTSSVAAVKAGRAAPTPSVASISSIAGSVVSIVDSDTTVDQSRDLVLLDLREERDFEQCRLPLAVSYPAARINRDQVSLELYHCKRDASKLLVVYHDNDQSSAAVATLLVQKGWETVHVLSGGFEEMLQSYPEVLQGQPPERPRSSGASLRPRSSAASVRSSPPVSAAARPSRSSSSSRVRFAM